MSPDVVSIMGPSEWIAVATLCVTMVSSMVAFAFFLGRKQTEVILEIERIRNDMHAIENEWERRLDATRMQLEAKIAEGPPYLKEMLDRTKELLELSQTNSGIAIQVAKQHGDELNEIRSKLDSHSDTLSALVIAVEKSNAN